MRATLLLLSFAAVTVFVACSKTDAPVRQTESKSTPNETSNRDACTLFSKEEILAVLGEEPTETKKLDQTDHGFHVSMCLFAMPTAANSITLRLVERAAGPDARDPRQAWNESFSREKLEGMEPGGEEGPLLLERIAGLGDDAYWRGQPKGGALYVLKGNAYIRISLTDTRNKEAALQKCSALAEMVLRRL